MSLADAERLHDEPLARRLARAQKFADPTQLGQWLRAQSNASIAAVWGLIAGFVEWVIARADAARWTYAGRAEVFFDDTPIEVHGPTFGGRSSTTTATWPCPGRRSGWARSCWPGNWVHPGT